APGHHREQAPGPLPPRRPRDRRRRGDRGPAPPRPTPGAGRAGERGSRRRLGRLRLPPRPRHRPPGVRGSDLSGGLADGRRGPPPRGRRAGTRDEPGGRPRRQVAGPEAAPRGTGGPRPEGVTEQRMGVERGDDLRPRPMKEPTRQETGRTISTERPGP